MSSFGLELENVSLPRFETLLCNQKIGIVISILSKEERFIASEDKKQNISTKWEMVLMEYICNHNIIKNALNNFNIAFSTCLCHQCICTSNVQR
jgi:hypothetical protein